MFQHILVTTDGSPLAHRALPYAQTLALHYGCTVTLLHVIPDPMSPATFGDFPKYARTYDEECQRLHDLAEVKLRHARALADIPGARTLAVQARGRKVAEVIANEADRADADGIVMSTHGRSGVKRTLLGSVAEDVVRRSNRPVLLVNERTVTDRTDTTLHDCAGQCGNVTVP